MGFAGALPSLGRKKTPIYMQWSIFQFLQKADGAEKISNGLAKPHRKEDGAREEIRPFLKRLQMPPR
jgi:hypothetical protein